MKFKKPLPQEEIRELFKNIEDPAAREKIILHNLRLVHWIAQKYHYHIKNDLEDLFQIGVFGLMEAIDKYDPTRGGNFSTVAVWYIKKHIRRNKIDYNENVSLDTVISKEDDSLTLKDTIEDEDIHIEEDITGSVFVNELLDYVKPKVREIEYNSFIMYHGIGCKTHTLEEIGNKYDRSKETTRQYINKVELLLKKSKYIKSLNIEREVDNRTSFYKGIDYTRERVSGGGIKSSEIEKLLLEREQIRNSILGTENKYIGLGS